MAECPKELRYTKDHEWARKVDDHLTIGITAHAQDALGDVVYVELPKIGARLKAGAAFGVVESTKAVSELFAPISGEVIRVNETLLKAPQTLNSDPYQSGWMIELKPEQSSDFDTLLDAEAYQTLLK